MLFIIGIIPLLVYYLIIVPLIKTKILNRKVTNAKYRRIIFVVLLFLPIGDQLIGYVVYKALCFTSSGTTIYQTVTDENEQKAFWFPSFRGVSADSRFTKDGIQGMLLPTKDLQQRKIAYWNECETNKKGYDCARANENIKRNNMHMYEKISHDKNILKLFNEYGRHHKLSTTYLIDDEGNQLIPAFLNECDSSLDNLSINNPKFKDSCKYTNSFIKEHNIPNIINSPKSKYKYIFIFSKLLFISKSTIYIKDIDLNKIIAEDINYSFYDGFYFSIFQEGRASSSCHEDIVGFQSQVIPNPYIKNLKK